MHDFEQHSIHTIEQIRTNAYEILDKAGTLYEAPPLKLWQKIVYPVLGISQQDSIEFDSDSDPQLLLLMRAAAQMQIPPRIRIFAEAQMTEMSEIEVRLSGKQPATGKNIDVISIELPEGSNDPFQTKVIMWDAPLPGSVPFSQVMESNFSSIVDITLKSLESINRHLPTDEAL